MDTDNKRRVLGYLMDVSGAKDPLTAEHVRVALDRGITERCFQVLDSSSGRLVKTVESEIARHALAFYRLHHQPITDRIVETMLRRSKLDAKALADYMQCLSDIHLRRNGGGEYLREANIIHLCDEIVRDDREQATIAMIRAWHSEEDEERKEELARRISQTYVQGPRLQTEEEALTLAQAASKDAEKYREVKANGLPTGVITTGFPRFDREVLYLRGGETLAVCARPNTGKSLQLLWMGLHNFRKKRNVLLANIQDSYEEQRLRLFSMLIKVNPRDIKSGRLERHGSGPESPEALFYRLPDFFEQFPAKYTILPPNRVRCVSDLEEIEYDRLKDKHYDLVIFDYLTAFRPSTSVYGERRDQAAAIADEMSRFAKRWDVPVMIGVQLNRETEMLARPSLKNIAECSVIEEVVDYIWAICPDPVSDESYVNWVMKSKTGPSHYDLPWRFYRDHFTVVPEKDRDQGDL